MPAKLLSHDREAIKTTLQQMPLMHLRETFQAFRLLDASLTKTIGTDWLERCSPANIPFDLSAILAGLLEPDAEGVLRSTLQNPDEED